jgi:hypothetical protein
MSRKYRQRGYQDDDRREDKPKSLPRRGPRDPSAPRSPKMPGFLTVIRCAMCGASVPEIEGNDFDAVCPKCSTALHSCKNCVNFDPNARFECTEMVEKRVLPKDARNECVLFEPRTRVEKEVSAVPPVRRSTPTDDPRAAFEKLFKK